MDCPSRSAQGLKCKFQSEHPGPHKALGAHGRTVTWGFRNADRPMYPGAQRRDFSSAEVPAPEPVEVTRCTSVYVERGLRHRCIKDRNHPGRLHRFMNVQWVD